MRGARRNLCVAAGAQVGLGGLVGLDESDLGRRVGDRVDHRLEVGKRCANVRIR